MQSVFVNRDGDSKERDATVNTVVERQKKICVDNQDFAPILNYCEGCANNGKVLLRFRRGAFEAGRPVRPTFTKTTHFGPVNPSYDTLKFFDMLCFMLSSLTFYHAVLTIMPPFIPNKYMYDKYVGQCDEKDDEDTKRWKAFSFATRDIMKDHMGDMELCN
jgi:hypothetical protein